MIADILQIVDRHEASSDSEIRNEDMVYLILHDDLSLHNTLDYQQIGISRLNNVLQSFSMQKHEVPNNGDCLFSFVILHLNVVFQIRSELNLIDHLNAFGITPQS